MSPWRVPLPGILAQDDARHAGGIELTASKLTVDGDGNISADGDLAYGTPQPPSGSPPLPGIQIPLAKPMDFILTVHYFKCSLVGSKVTPEALTADLTLPASFTTDDEDNPDRVTIHGISVNPKDGKTDLYADETETFSCRWNGFRLNAANGFTIDLSETQGLGGDGTSEKWQGVKLPQAKLSLPRPAQGRERNAARSRGDGRPHRRTRLHRSGGHDERREREGGRLPGPAEPAEAHRGARRGDGLAARRDDLRNPRLGRRPGTEGRDRGVGDARHRSLDLDADPAGGAPCKNFRWIRASSTNRPTGRSPCSRRGP